MKKRIVIIAFFVMGALALNAQPSEPTPGGSFPTPIPGLAILAAAGALVGAKAVHSKSREN
ncbi:hypothetical protein [Croceimicrobium hydrocarbonivorans]|uniref:PEP-CTERM sorting domain-containing protein n=1 Tax=Croceimicrobium hydrocarbonivorans TaxID=2761580 RepID=A0A7H0VGC1_9FLAO|nr:hypothetical protein [Croceimicrobium hydrocarbonivorans]QNR24769.1 hypothetical protein H4K34_02685 [Croceimicrobium hydrocarbonivorans]